MKGSSRSTSAARATSRPDLHVLNPALVSSHLGETLGSWGVGEGRVYSVGRRLIGKLILALALVGCSIMVAVEMASETSREVVPTPPPKTPVFIDRPATPGAPIVVETYDRAPAYH